MRAKEICDRCGELRGLQRVREPSGLEWDLCFGCVTDLPVPDIDASDQRTASAVMKAETLFAPAATEKRTVALRPEMKPHKVRTVAAHLPP